MAQLEQKIELADIAGQDAEAVLQGLEEQDAIVECAHPVISGIALEPAEHAGIDGGLGQDLGVGREDTMRRHGIEGFADRCDNAAATRIVGIKDTDNVHQFLDSDRAVIYGPKGEEVFDRRRSTALHLVDVDAGIEKQRAACTRSRAEEWQLGIRPPLERRPRSPPEKALRGLEGEGHPLEPLEVEVEFRIH
ncbi:MAG: hypothetical protein INR70_41265 [Parafilimonas terrae]|jgi:hypothetical protein|nr:hypothetical protein [Parafilimonas terrae]